MKNKKIHNDVLNAFSENEREEVEHLWEKAQRPHRKTELGGEATLTKDQIEQEWNKLQHRLKKPSSAKNHGAFTRYMWLGAAAAVFLLAMAGWYLFVPVTLEAPRGSYLTHEFNDGVQVELNSGSSLRWHRWSGHRNSHLSGEAFFEIPESDNPFLVETHNAQIRVYGTQFNVRSWPEDPDEETTLTLLQGSVTVASLWQPDTMVPLIPGQWSRVTASTDTPTEPEEVDTNQALAWRERGLFFSSTTLEQIIFELERRYDTIIHVEKGGLKERRLHLYMPSPKDLESIVESITYLTDSRFRWSDDKIILY